jgi:uncharacterized membrane protein
MDTQPNQAAWGNPARHENLWPARLAILSAAGLYITLPDKLTVGSKWIPPALELALLAVLAVMAPVRHRTEAQIQRVLSLSLIALINLANVGSLVLLIVALVNHGKVGSVTQLTGQALLVSALQIWLTNVIVFALWYWELDRGGPIARTRAHHREPDFLYPQMTTPEATAPNWRPHFVDYLYVSFTNATAFSPTDTMPLTISAKLLMMVQSLASLLTVALVAARAVNILS